MSSVITQHLNKSAFILLFGVITSCGENVACGCDPAPDAPWVTPQWGSGADDDAQDIATDSLGNLYVTGSTEGSIYGEPALGGIDMFITRHDVTGAHQWTRQPGNNSDQVGYAVGTDVNNNVYVAGRTGGMLAGQIPAGGDDLFVARYATDGTLSWVRQFGNTSTDHAYDIATDTAGNIFVVGVTGDVLDGQTWAGGPDAFIIKYSPSGARLWTRLLGSPASDVAFTVTVDAGNNIYLAGYTDGALNGQPLAGGRDGFIARYTTDGNLQWTRTLGSISDEEVHAIATDVAGNVYITGDTTGALDGQAAAGNKDIFVSKFDSNGTRQWTRQTGTSTVDSGNGIAIDSHGDIYVVGNTNGALNGEAFLGGQDGFIMKYDPVGSLLWTRLDGSTSADQVAGIAIDSGDAIYITGSTAGSIDGNLNLGLSDSFIIQYSASGSRY